MYYKSFQDCRSAAISLDDRIVATLAQNNFIKADELGYRRFNNSNSWLKDNEVLFSKAQWFMLNDDVKNQGYVKPSGECYDWVDEKLKKDSKW